jgi:cysteine desulfurase
MQKSKRRVYMDHAATTPVDPEVLDAMLPYFCERYGNASSLHTHGREARDAVEDARRNVSSLIGAEEKEIFFTSGGTESNNLAILGTARKKGRGRIITSSIEHPAVLEPCRYLEREGFEIIHLSVDEYGMIDPSELENNITKDTILITVMHANNEIGTIQDIREIGKIASDAKIPFHTDAVQSFGKIPINVEEMNIDMLSISSHKLHGPKGIGAIYIKDGIDIEPIIFGGGHERGIRSGTENVPGIVGLGKACELAKKRMKKDIKGVMKMRDRLIKGLSEKIPESYLNGHPTKRLPNNVNFRFAGVLGESLVKALDEHGISASAASACSSKDSDASHVLSAIGLGVEDARSSIRLTIGRENDKSDIEYVLDVFPRVIEKLRLGSQ